MKQATRVKTKKGLEDKIEDKKVEGYKEVFSNERQAKFMKRNYGSAFWHIVIFIFTFWTFGFCNLVYLAYSFFLKKDEITIKLESKAGE